ncbi:MAG: hypothetical protein KDE26_12905 [Bacteroidetes bacterium]|nr:hypothetical protein [Bacteroidota bacterium]
MKKTLLIIITFFAVLVVSSLFTGYSVVIDVQKPISKTEYDCNSGEEIAVFEEFDFKDGEWEAFLVLSNYDQELLSKKRNCFVLQDKDILNELRDLTFTCAGGDMTTVDSHFYLTRDGDLVFKSGIVLVENQEGLQSEYFGWAEATRDNELRELFERFRAVYLPLLII